MICVTQNFYELFSNVQFVERSLCINIAFSWYLAHSTHEANQSIEHFLPPYTALKSHSIHRSFLHITVTFCPRDYMLASGYNYGPLFYLVCRYHKPVFYRNGWTDRAGIWLRSRLHRLIGLIICSVLFFSRPRSEGWPHHGRTFSIYLCPLSTSWCCPSRPCAAFLAYLLYSMLSACYLQKPTAL